MNPFYQSIFDNIHALINAQKFEQAKALIDQELAVPYIPEDIQPLLEDLQRQIKAATARPVDDSAARLDSLMKGSPAAKEKAVTILQSLNLRNYQEEVQTLLNDSELLPEFKGELIRELVRQRVEGTFRLSKDGLDYTFDPANITPDCSDPVLIQTRTYFGDWLGGGFVLSEDFAGQLLEQEILEMLPNDFSGIDPEALAASIVRLVYLSMKDEDGWKQFQIEHSLEHVKPYPLKIEKRGETL